MNRRLNERLNGQVNRLFEHKRKPGWAGLAIWPSTLLAGLGLLWPTTPAIAQVDWEAIQRHFDGLGAPPAPDVLPVQITIDLSDRQLRLTEGDRVVLTYPVAVGRPNWPTPTGEFEVQQMIRDPAWMNPFTGEVIDGGHPRNPLGRFWIGFWTDGTNWVGMHGTPNPESVGTYASHGCVRLFNEDIQVLFEHVTMGTTVVVVP